VKKILLLALFILLAGCGETKLGTFTDARDGKTYKTVKIGTQTWMAENLNYEAEGSRCYGEGGRVITLSSSEIQANCKKYGRLYDWATAMGIDREFNKEEWNGSDVKHQGVCPKGWHLPSNAEWDKLYRYADGDKGTESPYDSEAAGKYLKAKSGWNEFGNGEDTYGFSALPGGFGNSDGVFYVIGYYGGWWNASEKFSSGAYYRGMGYNYERAYSSYMSKGLIFLSVRCVRD
jgi:uncharacterized protein (TIGR02145 family)